MSEIPCMHTAGLTACKADRNAKVRERRSAHQQISMRTSRMEPCKCHGPPFVPHRPCFAHDVTAQC